jgi:hypothetical protein
MLTVNAKDDEVDSLESLIAAHGVLTDRLVYQSRPKPADGPKPPPWWGSDEDADRSASLLASRLAMGR